MSAKHIHRYERVIMGKNNNVFFRCNLPDCNHYLSAKLAEGKRSICNRCEEPFILTRRAMKFLKPYCVDCVKPRNKSEMHDKLLEFVEMTDASDNK